jgi:hypothetical protein
MPFEEVRGANYRYDYYALIDKAAHSPWPVQVDIYQQLLTQDVWFLVYFAMGVNVANHPFWVEFCKKIDEGPQSGVLEVAAREHGKSTVITKGKSIQKALKNPEERIGIFSYVKPAAQSFLRSIKYILETSEFLKIVFLDVLYANPSSEAFRWSEEAGLYLKRRGSYSEATFEAHGLLEGMPTGKHFTGRVYDDIMTVDMADSPEMVEKVKEMFDMSVNLGVEGGWDWVIGTPYHHQDVIAYVENKKKPDGTPVYLTRKTPATIDGTPNGKPVLLSQERMDILRANPRMFRSQQLLDPTPTGEQRLCWENIPVVQPNEIPTNLYKFICIDPASDKEVSDSWAILLLGVDPYADDLGASDVYLLDAVIEPLDLIAAQKAVVDMYCKHPYIVRVGVEKVGASTFEIHIANALRARGRYVTLELGNLAVLRPGGRKKELRIETALSWPLLNGKIRFSSGVPNAYRERLYLEMKKFPFWHDDGLDSLSYVYDMIKEYRFGRRPVQEKKDAWAVDEDGPRVLSDSWMMH